LTQYFIEAEWFKLHSFTLEKFAVEFHPKTQQLQQQRFLSSYNMQRSQGKCTAYSLTVCLEIAETNPADIVSNSQIS